MATDNNPTSNVSPPLKRIIEKDANFKGMILFFDTSAIVKYFHSKNGTEAFRNGIDKYNIIMENRIK